MVALRIWLRRVSAIIKYLFTWKLRTYALTPFVISQRASPLLRCDTDPRLQLGEEQNVRRVADLLDGVVIEPGETFSWHATVGPPLRVRGFVPGPELRQGALSEGIGGGACQVSNLLYWLSVHAGLEIVERHRHSLDLIPDAAREVPFGCGATVFYPLEDLRLKNNHNFAVALSFRVDDGMLRGAVKGEEKLPVSYRLIERDARIENGWRKNRLVRLTIEDERAVQEETLCVNAGKMM